MRKSLQAGVAILVLLTLFLCPFFLVLPAIHRSCSDERYTLDCMAKGKWIWELSSKHRTFNSIDDESQAWRTCFRTNAKTIHREFIAFEHDHSYKDLFGDYGGSTDADPSGRKWHQIPLELWSSESPEAEAFFPTLTSCLHQSPLTSLIFSILDPWSEIQPHVGCSYTILRYQLNLELPQYDPENDLQFPQFGARRCAQETKFAHGELESGDTCLQAPVHLGVYDATDAHVKYYEWQQYGDMLFDDMNIHFVQNQTPERRVVIWGDVPRYDLPWYARIVVQFMHAFLPPFVPDVQDALLHNEAVLRDHAGIKTHFVGRYLELGLEVVAWQVIRTSNICILLISIASLLRRVGDGLKGPRRAECAGMKDV